MSRKVLIRTAAAAAAGIGMWILVFAVIGGSGRPMLPQQGDGQITETSAECNWGLSFQQEKAPPIGNAEAEYLKQYNAYYIDKNAGKEKNIYLTFDAGYENGYTEAILDVLKEEKVPAAFFLVGNYIEENPELVKRMVKEGHTVGNHTMHHPDMAAISEKSRFEKELKDLEESYKAATGEEIKKVYDQIIL